MIFRKILIIPIKFYQLAISPMIGGKGCCRFMPTCSDYAIESIDKLGIIKGGFYAFVRIIRCNPWGGEGYDPVHRKNDKLDN